MKAGSEESADKVKALFSYLKEFAAIQNRTVLLFQDNAWTLDVADIPRGLPSVSLSFRDVAEDEPLSDEPLLRVVKPDFEACPAPDSSFEDWLREGWDSYVNEAAIFETRKLRDRKTGETREQRFSDNETRVRDYTIWLEQRTRWVDAQRKIEAARKLFNDLYAVRADLNRSPETLELMAGTGFFRTRNSGVDHPVLLKKVAFEFDEAANSLSIVDTDARPELYSALFHEAADLNLEYIREAESQLADDEYHPFDRSEAAPFLKRLTHALSARSEFSQDPNKSFSSPDVEVLLCMRPVFFVRRRIDGAVKYIERLVEAFQDGEVAPPLPFLRSLRGDLTNLRYARTTAP